MSLRNCSDFYANKILTDLADLAFNNFLYIIGCPAYLANKVF